MLLLFLVFVVLLAGVVAYAADNIGRRVGRKHLRLFGLRPKTTALLVAVGAGMGISLLSLLAFFALNRQAIRNIEQADTLRVELGKLRRDVTAVRGDLGAVTKERDAANTRASRARDEAAQAQSKLQDAQTQLQGAQGALSTAEQQTATLRTQAGTLARRVAELTTLRAGLEAQAEQNRQALTASRTDLTAAQAKLEGAQAQLQGAQAKLETAQAQVQRLNAENASAQTQADAAQAKARAAATLAAAAQQRVSALQAQISSLDASRRDVVAQRDAAATSLRAVQAQRDAVQRSVASLRTDVANLRAQSQALQSENAGLLSDNGELRRNLSDSQATVTRLEDEYSRATSELTAARNAPTVYPKNAIVYGGTVASVRNLNDFLAQAGQAAAAKGVRATPAVQLSGPARSSLEATLRGLNTSTFVLCRSLGNATAAAPVPLSCDARNNALLYAQGSVIRQGTINLGGGDEAMRSQLRDLLGDAVLDLTSKGVPLEYVLSGNLDLGQLVTTLGKLADAGRSTAEVAVMPRADVKPGSRVNLYAALVQ